MAFDITDVDKYKSGLDDTQKQKWVKIADAALEACRKDGGEGLACEAAAVKTACKRADSEQLTEGAVEEIQRVRESHLSLLTRISETPIQFNSVELLEGEWQLVLPIGRFQLSGYGELVFTRRFMERVAENYADKRLGIREPFIDTNHDFGAANGWIIGMQVGERGLEVRIDWTPLGRKRLSDREYRYFSATISAHKDVSTGDLIFPVVPAVTLTNIPAMNMMPEAHLEVPDGKRNVKTAQPEYRKTVPQGAPESRRKTLDENEQVRVNLKDMGWSDSDIKKYFTDTLPVAGDMSLEEISATLPGFYTHYDSGKMKRILSVLERKYNEVWEKANMEEVRLCSGLHKQALFICDTFGGEK